MSASAVVNSNNGGTFGGVGDAGGGLDGQALGMGQGYGIIIVALMAGDESNAQTIYDSLQRFARAMSVIRRLSIAE